MFLSDLQNMVSIPKSSDDIKPRHDPTDSSPSEYNPLPHISYGPTDSHSSYHPRGSIPTPVLIAQKIAENQAGDTFTTQPSSMNRRSSLEYEKPSSPSTDPHSKHGPPTSAKPTRYPANINVILGNKDHLSHSLSNVNIHERQAKMLANLTGSHPLLQQEVRHATEQNIPRRSISLKDPTPDKSRMEALSKLGLSRNRAMSGGTSLLVTPNRPSMDPMSPETGAKLNSSYLDQSKSPESNARLNISSLDPPNSPEIRAKPNNSYLDPPTIPELSTQPNNPSLDPLESPETNTKLNISSLDPRKSPETRAKPNISYIDSLISPETNTIPNISLGPSRGPESATPLAESNVMPRHQNHIDGKSEIPPPPVVPQSNYSPPPLEPKAPGPPPPEVTSLEFNNYGGKSIVVKPPVSSKSEPPTSPTTLEPKLLPPALASRNEFNTYGGKTKAITPAPVVVRRSDLPDILSSHIDKNQTLSDKSDLLPKESNSYGGKSRTINPSTALNPPTTRNFKAPAPTPAPKPPRHSYHGPITTQKTAPRASSPEHKRRPGSMFRPQGITVQFSGRGATDESRKDALRKLGLLKDS